MDPNVSKTYAKMGHSQGTNRRSKIAALRKKNVRSPVVIYSSDRISEEVNAPESLQDEMVSFSSSATFGSFSGKGQIFQKFKMMTSRRSKSKDLQKRKTDVEVEEAYDMCDAFHKKKLHTGQDEAIVMKQVEFSRQVQDARHFYKTLREMRKLHKLDLMNVSESTESLSKVSSSVSPELREALPIHEEEGSKAYAAEKTIHKATQDISVQKTAVISSLETIYRRGKNHYDFCLQAAELGTANDYFEVKNEVAQIINDLKSDKDTKSFQLYDFMQSWKITGVSTRKKSRKTFYRK